MVIDYSVYDKNGNKTIIIRLPCEQYTGVKDVS